MNENDLLAAALEQIKPQVEAIAERIKDKAQEDAPVDTGNYKDGRDGRSQGIIVRPTAVRIVNGKAVLYEVAATAAYSNILEARNGYMNKAAGAVEAEL